MHSLMSAVLPRMAGLDALDLDAELSHQTGSFERLNKQLRLAKGNAVVGADGPRQAKLLEDALKHRESIDFLGRMQGFAGHEIAAGEVGDGQRIAISAVGKHELALVVGTPQLIRLDGSRERGALGPAPSPGSPLDQAMAIEHRVYGADRGRVYIRIKSSQSFPDLRRPPARLVLLAPHDQRLDLDRELIGMAIGAGVGGEIMLWHQAGQPALVD